MQILISFAERAAASINIVNRVYCYLNLVQFRIKFNTYYALESIFTPPVCRASQRTFPRQNTDKNIDTRVLLVGSVDEEDSGC